MPRCVGGRTKATLKNSRDEVVRRPVENVVVRCSVDRGTDYFVLFVISRVWFRFTWMISVQRQEWSIRGTTLSFLFYRKGTNSPYFSVNWEFWVP